MPELTTDQLATFVSAAQSQGGMQAFMTQVANANAIALKAAAVATLSPVCSGTVTDWPTVKTFIAGATNEPIGHILDELDEIVEATSGSPIPLLWALYGSLRAHYGRPPLS